MTDILILCALLISAGLLLLVVAEFMTRAQLKARAEYYVWPRGWRALFEVDRNTLPMLPEKVRWEINEAGERGDPLPKSWDNTLRVVAAGGSTTECYFIDQDSTWPSVLQGILCQPENAAKLGVERTHVGNIGRSVTNMHYLRGIFERSLPHYGRINLVIFFVGASDIVRWMHMRAPEDYPDDDFPTDRMFSEHPDGPFGFDPRKLALRKLVSGWMLRWRRPIEKRSQVGQRLAGLRQQRAESKTMIETAPDYSPPIDRFERNLREFHETLEGRVDRVLYVTQPWFDAPVGKEEGALMWNFALGMPHREKVDTYYSHPVVAEMLSAIADRGVKVATELGMDVLDLRGRIESDLTHYYDFLHHTPAGNRRVAEEIAKAVLS